MKAGHSSTFPGHVIANFTQLEYAAFTRFMKAIMKGGAVPVECCACVDLDKRITRMESGVTVERRVTRRRAPLTARFSHGRRRNDSKVQLDVVGTLNRRKSDRRQPG